MPTRARISRRIRRTANLVRCKVLLVFVLLLIWIGFSLIRAPTIIFPPAAPTNPVNVYVADYGYHSRLALPEPDGTLIQYTYGDWRYFALRQQTLLRGLEALLMPTPGALGRRRYEDLESLQQSLGLDWPKMLHAVPVTAENLTRLLERLDRRYQNNLRTEVVQSGNERDAREISFVQDELDYTLFHNSNHELVEWLEELGCEVEGFITWPNFEVAGAD